MIKNKFLWQIPFLLFLFVFSCKKKDQVPGTTSRFIIVNASPNAGSIELLQNLHSLGQFSYINGIYPAVNYITADSGFNNYKIKKGTSEIANWLFVNEGLHLSLFVCDTLIASKAKYFFLKDNLDTAGMGNKSKIRLVHMSPDLDTVSLSTNRPSNLSSDSLIISNIDYFGNYNQAGILTASDFQNFYGDSVVNIKIKKKSNNLLLKQYQFNFKKGKIYSLLLKGYAARGGNDSLSLSIIQHN
jgi:hypothetical protein